MPRARLVVAALASSAFAVSACAAPGEGSDRSSVSGGPRAAPYAGASTARTPDGTCGVAPYVDMVVTLLELRDSGEIAPLRGAIVSFDVCPSFAVTTDEFGMATASVPRGVPIVTKLSAPGHVTSLVSQNVLSDDAIVTDLLPTTKMARVLPGYSPDSGTVAVYLDAIGTGACAQVDGASLRVVGHPEAKVVYMAPAWPSDATPAGTLASVGDVVFFTGLPDGDVELEGTKPGCHVAATGPDSQTGKFPVLRGAWTVGNVYVDD